MNLPNLVTTIRLFLVPVFFVLWWKEYYILASLVFFIASATDLLDGYLARKMDETTKLGALLDPFVDKILVATGFLLLVGEKAIPAWAVVVILSREVIITGLRAILADKGIILKAGPLGKLKTFLQTAAIFFLFLGLSLKQHNIEFVLSVVTFGSVVFWGAFTVTLVSGIQYVVNAKNMFESRNKTNTIAP